MSDPNWFYSTLAQSTAAMVAVGVAFFVPHLQTELRKAQNRAATLRSAILDTSGEWRTIAENGQAAADAMTRGLAEFDNAPNIVPGNAGLFTGSGFLWQGGGHQPETPNEEDVRRWKDFQPRTAEFATFLMRTADTLLDTIAGKAPSTTPPAWLLVDPPADPRSPFEQQYGNNPGYWRELEYGQEYMKHTWLMFSRRVQSFQDEHKQFARDLPSWTLWLPFAMVFGLLVFGLLVPLGYLSAQPGNSKVILVGGSGLLTIALLVFFGRQILQVRALAGLPDPNV